MTDVTANTAASSPPLTRGLARRTILWLISAVLLIYARLLGRLGWKMGEVLVQGSQ